MSHLGATEGRWHRIRSYLTSTKFRHKIAAYIFGVMLLVGIIYTALIWGTTSELSEQITLTTQAREQAAEMSQALHLSVLMNEELKEEEAFMQQIEARSAEINAQYKEEMKKAADAERRLLSRQKYIFWGWLIGYSLITFLVVFFASVFTRRIASPMQDIQKTIEEVSRGKLGKPKELKGSGEFQALHACSIEMIGSLRADKEHILAEGKAAIVELESPVPQKGIERLRRLLKAVEAQLRERV